MTPTAITLNILIAGIVLGLFTRLRRLMARERIVWNRLVVRAAGFATAGALYLSSTLHDQPGLIGGLVGLVLGCIVAMVGLRFTTFENTGRQEYYTPNPIIGIGLFLIFAIRLGFAYAPSVRAILHTKAIAPGQGAIALAHSHAVGPLPISHNPLTSAVIVLMVSYYAFYYAGLLLVDRPAGPARVSPLLLHELEAHGAAATAQVPRPRS